MKKHPVTDREYIAFLNDLYHNGRREEALKYAPKEGDKIAMKQCTNSKKVVFTIIGSGFCGSWLGLACMLHRLALCQCLCQMVV